MVTRAERLEGKPALVTGGARSQGEAIARSFVDEGARVVFDDVADETGESVAASIGSAAAFRHLDVIDRMSWQSTVEWCSCELGDLNVLVNNARLVRAAPLETTTLDDVAMLTLFLASDESGYCIGSEFVVDGGSSTGIRV